MTICRRDRLIVLLDHHAVLVHLPFQQQERVVDQLGQVGRFLAAGAVAGHAQHRVGDRRRPIGGGQDLLETLVASGGVLVPRAHLGVVEDRHQHIVELVGRGTDQLTQRGETLSLGKLLFEELDLLLKT